jgi:hypothetical protein
MFATRHFLTISEEIRPELTANVHEKSIPARRPWPMTRSSALCRPISSAIRIAFPSPSKSPTRWMPPVIRCRSESSVSFVAARIAPAGRVRSDRIAGSRPASRNEVLPPHPERTVLWEVRMEYGFCEDARGIPLDPDRLDLLKILDDSLRVEIPDDELPEHRRARHGGEGVAPVDGHGEGHLLDDGVGRGGERLVVDFDDRQFPVEHQITLRDSSSTVAIIVSISSLVV